MVSEGTNGRSRADGRMPTRCSGPDFAKGGKIRNEALNNDDTKKQHVIDCERLPLGTRGAVRVNLCVSKGTPTLYAMTYEALRDLWIEYHVPGYKAPA
jgi:hypothetical protein